MGKFLYILTKSVKEIPKPVWVAAVIIPGGFIAMGTYIITKTVHEVKNEK